MPFIVYILESMKVRVYRNLTKKCLSVQTMTDKGWRVTRHVQSISLKDATFKVSEAGRQRVIRDRRKNVHAIVEGYETDSFDESSSKQVTYNPYKSSHFYYRDQPNKAVLKSRTARIKTSGIEINS